VGFKEAIQEYGKEITASFVCGGVTYKDDDIISMNPHYEGSLLSSVMKCLDLEIKRTSVGDTTAIAGVAIAGQAIAGVSDISDAAIILSPKFGVKAPGDTDYSYLEYGTHIVKEKKFDEEQDTILLECYDLMLLSMVPYDLHMEYPVTVAEYLDAVCTRFGWAKRYTTFVNSDKVIEEEKYDAGYTFRDVLDEIAQVAGGMIAFVGDELDVIYPTDSGETIDSSNLKTLKMGESYGPVNSVVLSRSPQEDNIYRQDDDSIATYGITEIRIENNQIMDSHREDFIDGILGALLGLSFEMYELESFGIGYLSLGDFFTIQTPDGENHTALMLCDDMKITQGLTETSHLETPEVTETDYSAASETDRVLNKTILKVDKQSQEITALVSKTENIESDVAGLSGTVTRMSEVMIDSDSVDIKISDAVGGINSITTSTGYTFDQDGLHIQKFVDGEAEGLENLLDNTGMYVKRGGDDILTANNDGVDAINLKSRQFLIIGDNSRFENYESNRTACFYIGGS
jgi:hypothetical protein